MTKVHWEEVKKSFWLAVTYAGWLITKWTTGKTVHTYTRSNLELLTVPEPVETIKKLALAMMEPGDKIDLERYLSYDYDRQTWRFVSEKWSAASTFPIKKKVTPNESPAK